MVSIVQNKRKIDENNTQPDSSDSHKFVEEVRSSQLNLCE